MTGGRAVILGRAGSNFGAGMTGGMAFVLDPDRRFETRANPGSILWQRLESDYWREELRSLVERHAELTGSAHARGLLDRWDRVLPHFWQVCPKDMLDKLDHPISADEGAAVAAQ